MGGVTLDDCARLKINELKPHLPEFGRTDLVWHWPDESRVDIELAADEMVIRYQHRRPGEDWRKATQLVRFTSTPCHYGGSRPWFECMCGRRVGLLVSPQGRFICRYCADLPYQCQSETDLDRACRKLRKIQRHLGAEEDVLAPQLCRPKGMWRRTHVRLVREALKAYGVIQAYVASHGMPDLCSEPNFE